MTKDDAPDDEAGEGEGPPDELVEADLAPEQESLDVDMAPTRGGIAPLMSLAAAGEAVKETSLSRLPQQLGRYTLTKRLGIGGMAEVFLAEQQGAAGFKKACVVKRMLSHLALQPRYVEMFLREARLASQLSHANIVQIWDLGEVDGQYFIAMEYIDGMPLNLLARTSWRTGQPLPMEVICCAMADAAEGLAVAHEWVDADGKPAPIVHRDISPDNLMIDRDGVTKILDFGIARTHDSERTQAGELKGKVPFMPLEQLRGDVVDARADIYALGVTAYWLLTGKRPFTAPTDMALIEVIASQEAKPLTELNPQIPQELNDLVLRMIAKNRDDRMASVREVSAALEHVLGARKTVVVPFVRTLIDDLNRAGPEESFAGSSNFYPSTPHTDSISGGWRIRTNGSIVRTDLISRADHASSPSGPLPVGIASTPPSSPAAVGGTASALMAPPRRRLPLAAAAAAGALVMAILAVVALRSSAPADPPAVVDAPVVPAPPAPPPPEVVVAPPPAPPPPGPPPPEPPPPEPVVEPLVPVGKKPPAAEAAPRSIVVKGPPSVQWLLNGKALGSGDQTLKVPASAKSLIAYDKKRNARTKVPLGAGTIDYGKLPKGKLQPRAKPFADVFIGSEALGATPFSAVDVVAGSYAVKFVYKGKERTETVVVAPGAVARPTVDFTQP